MIIFTHHNEKQYRHEEIYHYHYSSIEVDAGVTPGYLSGKRADSFYMTGDIGLKTSWRIWRMNLSINPAMHYLLTDKINMGTYKIHLTTHERWQLSLVFGVSIML